MRKIDLKGKNLVIEVDEDGSAGIVIEDPDEEDCHLFEMPVRCFDCKFYKKGQDCFTRWINGPNDFCSRGVRK